MGHAVHVVLAAHPGNPASFAHRLDATLACMPDGGLAITYAIAGPTAGLRIPTPASPAPPAALWRTTCCELFAAAAGATGYREFNFSPSGQWASHDFSDYRLLADRNARLHAPSIRTAQTDDGFQLDVELPPDTLPANDSKRLALSVVLESRDGRHGYWALAHPEGKPDFHHRLGFTLQLGTGGFHP